MEDEVKFKLDDVDRRIVLLDKRFDDQTKRFDDVKWFVGGFAVVFASLTAIAGWNYNNERQGLREFQKEIKDQISKVDDTTLELSGANSVSLSGQDVDAEFDPEGWLVFEFGLKNVGDSNSGPIFVKLYTRADLRLDRKSSDDADYVYEAFVAPDILKPNSLPGKMSINYRLQFYVPPGSVAAGRHAARLKLYYGRGKIASAPFNFVMKAGRP